VVKLPKYLSGTPQKPRGHIFGKKDQTSNHKDIAPVTKLEIAKLIL
jgi:hypothetical protein